MLDKVLIREKLGDFLISHYGVNIKKNFKCISGTHPDRHPSMSYNKNDHYVKCFACQFQGDIFVVAQHFWNCDFKTAALKLEALYPECSKDQPVKLSPYSYLKTRGILPETAKQFGVQEVSDYIAYDKEGKEFHFGPAICVPPEPKEPIQMVRSTKGHRFYKPAGITEKIFFLSQMDTVDPIFIVESVFCALTIYQEGGHAIPLNGRGWQKVVDEIENRISLGKQIPPLILSLDKDSAGEESSKLFYDALQGIEGVRVLNYPISGSEKDPNDLYLKDPVQLRCNMQQAIKMLSEKPIVPNKLTDYVLNDFLTELRLKKERVVNRKTGFAKLDQALGGIGDGLYILGGRPGVGKSTFLDQLAWELGKTTPVLYFSYEQTKIHFATKQLGRLSFLTQEKPFLSSELLQGMCDDRVIEMMDLYVEENRNCFFLSVSSDVQDLIKTIEKYEVLLDESPIIIIDYLQRVSVPGKATKDAIDFVLTKLAQFTHEQSRTMILVSSFNRTSYYSPIAMDSYRESGNVEFAADYLLGLQYDCLRQNPLFSQEGRLAEKQTILRREEQSKVRNVELVCVKNKYGSQFQIPLSYYTENDCFEERKESVKKRI